MTRGELKCTMCGGDGHTRSQCKLQPSKLSAGVRNVADILARCFADPETGCWVWRYAVNNTARTPTPLTSLPQGLSPELTSRTIPAARAAWLLAGRTIPAGNVVYRKHCGNALCCNPEHGATGTRREMRNFCAESGREKGDPHRRAVNTRRAAAVATPVEVVRQIEARRAAGALIADLAEEFGLSRYTVVRINTGKHRHSAGRTSALPASSVFSWGRA